MAARLPGTPVPYWETTLCTRDPRNPSIRQIFIHPNQTAVRGWPHATLKYLCALQSSPCDGDLGAGSRVEHQQGLLPADGSPTWRLLELKQERGLPYHCGPNTG